MSLPSLHANVQPDGARAGTLHTWSQATETEGRMLGPIGPKVSGQVCAAASAGTAAHPSAKSANLVMESAASRADREPQRVREPGPVAGRVVRVAIVPARADRRAGDEQRVGPAADA